MNQIDILYPVFVQVLLVFVVAVMMSRARRRASFDRESMKALALGRFEWPEDAVKRAANYTNQFELPVLFYAVVAFALIVKAADLPMIVMAWLFVLLRIAHAAVHIGPNRVRVRAPIFMLGFLVVLAMWVKLALHVALH